MNPATVGDRVTGALEGFAVGVYDGEYVTPAAVGARVPGALEGLAVGVLLGA